MAEDAGKLLELTLSPEVSRRYSDICRMQPGQLVKRLESEAVSIDGEMSELRGRLLRLEVRRASPGIETPWYLEDEISVEKRGDSGEDSVAEALWQLREASRKAEVDGQLYERSLQRIEDAVFPKTAKTDEDPNDITEDEDASNASEENGTGFVSSIIAYLTTYYECIRKFQFSTCDVKATLFVALDALKAILYTWILDTYVFYNKGFHIYVAVYWIIMSLYSLNEDKHRLHVYIQKYPFDHRTKLLMYSLIRVAVIVFSFTCINSFVWFDNVMLACFIIFKFVSELCILIKEINDYELGKLAPHYFFYSDK